MLNMPAKIKYLIVGVVTLALAAGIIAYDVIKAKPAEVAAAPTKEATVVAKAEPVVVKEEPAPAPVVEAPAPVTPSWHFYNLDLQNNATTDDDYNFGPPPQVTEASNLDQELRSRMREDPVLGAAVMAWADSVLGTSYLGRFFDECNEEWDAAMNKAAHAWTQDKEEYDKTLDAFFQHLDRASMEVRDKKGLKDQMYMNPDTKDGIPEIIILETDNHEGKFLVYTFTIKGSTKKEIMYRLDCGFQPTNVAGTMKKVTVKQKVVGGGGKINFIPVISGGGGKSGGGGSDPTPKPDPKPPKPTPPTPKPIKDPTKGTPVLPNDDKGPGPNTNTGPGGQYSSRDLPGNSNDLTPEEYRKIIEQMENANSGSREGGDPNTPSTPTPADTTPDNNGDTGNGNGGIDEPTPVSPGPVDDDPPGEAWDGPPDA